MIEISKLVTGAKINPSTPPVEAARASAKTEGETKVADMEIPAPSYEDERSVPVPAAFGASEAPDPEAVQAAMERANSQLDAMQTSLSFQMNEELDRVIVRLVDTDTGEVIRQYPPEEIVAMSERLNEAVDRLNDDKSAILGVLVDHKH